MRRLGFLDGLRGLAALYVVIMHVFVLSYPPLVSIPLWLQHFAYLGGSGVTLFFVVSAFSLCLTWERHAKTGHALLSYSISRFFRIAPLFYLLLLVTCVWYFCFLYRPLRWADIFANAAFAFNLIPGSETGVVWAGWTIGVEMLFYLLFPVLRAWQTTLSRNVIVLCAAIILDMIFNGLMDSLISDQNIRDSFVQFSLFRHLPTFLFGILAYDLYRLTRFGEIRSRYGGALVGVGALALAAIAVGATMNSTVAKQVIVITGPCYALVLLGLTGTNVVAIDNLATRFLGRISYSTYLWHPLLILAIRPAYWLLVGVEIPEVRFLLYVLATVAVLIPWAYVSYRLVELPGVYLGHRVFDWFARPARDIVQATHAAVSEETLISRR